jgi:flagellar basal body-associated protein FliL
MGKNTISAKSLKILGIVFILILISGVFYIRNTWFTSKEKTSELALKSAQTAEAALNGEMIKSLHGVPEDIGTIAYESIKRRLIDIRSVHPEVRFVYIYCQTDGKLYFMADSEPVESSDYSPPGQEYTEARDEDKKPFQNQMSVIQEPFTDRWGSWVSILVPMKDAETGKVIALFGMDYPADMWNIEAVNKTIQSVMIVVFLLLLVILFYVISNKNIAAKGEKSE